MHRELALADPQSESVSPRHDLEDAHHAIDYVSGWIRAADTKAGLLSAAIALMITGMLQQDNPIGTVPTDLAGIARVLIWVGLLVAVLAVGATIAPRTSPTATPCRFAFPTLADGRWTRSVASRSNIADEAWVQAKALAVIAKRKHQAVWVASWATFISLFLLVFLLGLGP